MTAEAPTFTIVPGQFHEAINWIESTLEREDRRFRPTWVRDEPEPSYIPIQRPYTKILAGQEAFWVLRKQALYHPAYSFALRYDGWHNQLFGLDVERRSDMDPLAITLG